MIIFSHFWKHGHERYLNREISITTISNTKRSCVASGEGQYTSYLENIFILVNKIDREHMEIKIKLGIKVFITDT